MDDQIERQVHVSKPLLAAFDFDHTICEHNTDIIARDLLPSHLLTAEVQAIRSVGWNEYMSAIFTLLYKQRVPEDDIRDAICSIPPVEGMVELIKKLKNNQADVIIISDSNTYFISEWLKEHELNDYVDAIFSNPAFFNNGKLSLEKYHIQDWCNLSSDNLCKGFVLNQFLEHQRLLLKVSYKVVMYVGDGSNDYCPALKLTPDDYLFVRREFSLMNLLAKEEKKSKVLAQVHTFSTGLDILSTLTKLDLIK